MIHDGLDPLCEHDLDISELDVLLVEASWLPAAYALVAEWAADGPCGEITCVIMGLSLQGCPYRGLYRLLWEGPCMSRGAIEE